MIIIINFGCGLYKKWWDSDVTTMFAVVCVWISALDINKDFHEKSNSLNFTLPKCCACGLHKVDMAQAFLGHWCLKISLGYEQIFFYQHMSDGKVRGLLKKQFFGTSCWSKKVGCGFISIFPFVPAKKHTHHILHNENVLGFWFMTLQKFNRRKCLIDIKEIKLRFQRKIL